MRTRNQISIEFKYDGNAVKVVDLFKYLGVYFNTKGTFSETKVHLPEQATKAMFSLLKKWRQLDIPVHLMLELFDKSVVPIVLHSPREIISTVCDFPY